MAAPLAATRIVICGEDAQSEVNDYPTGRFPFLFNKTAFVELNDFCSLLRQELLPAGITILDCQRSINLRSADIVKLTLLESLTLNGIRDDVVVDLSSCLHLKELAMLEIADNPSVVLAPHLRTCKLCENVRILNATLPESLQDLVFADDKDWTVPAGIVNLYFTGEASDLTIPGDSCVNVAAINTNIYFTGKCEHLERVYSECAITFPADCGVLPKLKVYIAGDVPTPECPIVKCYGLNFGDDTLEQELSPEVDLIIREARARFADRSEIYVSPTFLIEGKTPFACCLDQESSNFIRISLGAEELPPSPYYFVVEYFNQEEIGETIRVGEVIECVDGEGSDECAVCMGKLIEPSCPYACGAQFFCKSCVASSKRLVFPFNNGLVGVPRLEFPSLKHCPLCRESMRV